MFRRILSLTRVLPALGALLAAMPASADVWRVTADLDPVGVQNVMDTAVYGDTVLVEPGEYMMLTVRNGIHLLGEKGPEETIFRYGRVVLTVNEADSNTVIEGITVDGIKASEGIIVAEHSNARIRNCIIKNGWVGVRSAFAAPVVENCTIRKCQRGIFLSECEGLITGNDIRECVTAIEIFSSSPRVFRNVLTGNSLGIFVDEHSNAVIGGSLATANRVFKNPGGAIKNRGLVK
ncbi:MAG: hypothetical protein HKN12_00470, partial [Gemmatimonadetes bacterium]|nr:hypothetical protein [Gemmatimonadota bacterium]